jgi:hypothetical protein
MRIHNNPIYDSICSVGAILALALMVGGCSDEAMDEEVGKVVEPLEETSAGDSEYVSEAVTVVDKKAIEEQAKLTTKGTWCQDMTRGRAFNVEVTVVQGQTITCTTSQSGDSMDTMMALVRRDDGYTGGLSDPSWDHQARFSTMAYNDDYSGLGLYSRIQWTNPGGATSFRLLVWSYYNNTGTANVSCTWSNPSSSQSWSNRTIGATSRWTSCDQGAAHTVSSDGGDPYLILVDPTIGGGNGYWNDDTVSGSDYEAHFTGLTGISALYIMGGYTVGTSTLCCP